MEEKRDDHIKALESKIALLKADRDELYVKLSMAKQTVQSLHTDIGQIMEFIVEKRKDLSFIGPEFSSILNADDETKIHEIEFDFPNIHTLISKDFEKVQKNNPGVSRIRLRGADLFKNVSSDMIKKTYPAIDDDRLNQYLDIIWNQMSFPEKKNWIEKRVVYGRVVEPTEPTEPTEPVEPVEPVASKESEEPMDPMEPMEPELEQSVDHEHSPESTHSSHEDDMDETETEKGEEEDKV